MPSRPDFTRKTVPAAAPVIPNTGTPLPVGKVMMTPDTRKQMEAMGWKDGDPIPVNLAQKVSEVQARYQEELATARVSLPPNHVPPRIKLVDIATLPPEAQRELRDFMAEAAQLGVEEQARQAAEAQIEGQIPANASPGVVEAIRTSARAAQQAGPTAVVAPMRPRPAPSPAPEPAVAPAPATPEAAPEEAATVAGGSQAQPTHCPRCQWDMSMAFELTPTEDDRSNFVAALLGTSRFRKMIPLLDGKLQLTFRSLTAREAELLFSQLRTDIRADLVVTDADYFTKLQVYRMVMGLEKIVSEDRIVAEVPEILTVPFTAEEGKSLLTQMEAWFWESAVPQEPLRRIVAQHHRAFQRLVETLEAQTSEPDFWKGIGPRA